MIVFPEIAASCAENAGIKIPENLEEYDPMDYPHWHVYQAMQLGAPMPWPSAHWENAAVIAAIPENQIMSVTYDDLVAAGFAVGNSSMYA